MLYIWYDNIYLTLVRSDAELCVEDMWRKVRAHSARKMRPVENHILQLKVSKTVLITKWLYFLKRSSSPFIRDFLQKIESEGLQVNTITI